MDRILRKMNMMWRWQVWSWKTQIWTDFFRNVGLGVAHPRVRGPLYRLVSRMRASVKKRPFLLPPASQIFPQRHSRTLLRLLPLQLLARTHLQSIHIQYWKTWLTSSVISPIGKLILIFQSLVFLDCK